MTASLVRAVRTSFFLCLLALFLFTSGGCGYITGSLLPAHLKTIYIDNFRNKIDIGKEVTEGVRYTLYRPGIENDLTRAVEDRFIFDGNLDITSKENADLILTGELISYRQDPLRYDADDNVEEYRIVITVNMVARETAIDEVMWEEASFSGDATYMTTGRFATSEDTAREEAIENLARRIVERTVELW